MSESKIADWPRPRGEKEIRGLLERASSGDATDLAELGDALDGHPGIWRAYGDLAAHARDAWIGLICGADLALKESLGRQVASMQTELAGPAPSPLEKLLVERIVACWLQVGYADAAAAQSREMSTQQGHYCRKRQDSAHRRYLTALAALTMTRRLLASPVATDGLARLGRRKGSKEDHDTANDQKEAFLTFRRIDQPESPGGDPLGNQARTGLGGLVHPIDEVPGLPMDREADPLRIRVKTASQPRCLD